MDRKKVLYYNKAINSPEGPSIHARALLGGMIKTQDVKVYPAPRAISYVKNGRRSCRRHVMVEWGLEFLRAVRGVACSCGDFCVLSLAVLKRRPDFVLTRSYEYSIATILLRAVWKVPVIVEINGLLYNERKTLGLPSLTWFRKFFEAWGLESADGVYVVSDELVKELDEEGISYKRITTIANGVDLDKFNMDIPPRNLKKDPREIIIGFTGSLYPWHGVDVLIKSMKMVRGKYPDARLVIVGDGGERNNLEKQSVELGLNGCITFLGSVNHVDIPSIVGGFDIAVAPYNPQGTFYFSPLKVYEYMAMGKAIIGSELGQISSLIENDEGGLLVPPGNAIALAKAVSQLIGDEEQRRSMGDRNAQEARRSHSWDVAVRKIVEFFDEVVSGIS